MWAVSKICAISLLGFGAGLLTVSAAHRCGFWEKPPKKNIYILLNNLKYQLLKLPSFLLADLISLSFELLAVVEFDLLQVEKHLPQLLCCLPGQTQTINQILNQQWQSINSPKVYMHFSCIFKIYWFFTWVCRHLSVQLPGVWPCRP